MTLEILKPELTVCKLPQGAPMPTLDGFVFWAQTDRELSLVCESAETPAGTLESSPGWRALRVCGTLDFSLTGILSAIAGVLAAEKVSIFALSTFDTDYVLVRTAQLEQAVQALQNAGYGIL